MKWGLHAMAWVALLSCSACNTAPDNVASVANSHAPSVTEDAGVEPTADPTRCGGPDAVECTRPSDIPFDGRLAIDALFYEALFCDFPDDQCGAGDAWGTCRLAVFEHGSRLGRPPHLCPCGADAVPVESFVRGIGTLAIGDVNARCSAAEGTFPCQGAPGYFCDVGRACIVHTDTLFDEISERAVSLTVAGCSFDTGATPCDSDVVTGLCALTPSACTSDVDGNVTVVCD